MYDQSNNQLVPMSPELVAKFADPEAVLTVTEQKQRNWTRFEEGEIISLKGIAFRLHEVGENRLVLKPMRKEAA